MCIHVCEERWSWGPWVAHIIATGFVKSVLEHDRPIRGGQWWGQAGTDRRGGQAILCPCGVFFHSVWESFKKNKDHRVIQYKLIFTKGPFLKMETGTEADGGQQCSNTALR